MPGWTFITNHGLVLSCVARHQQITAREIASTINITERTVLKIIADLDTEGYIERKRVGRNNFYYIDPHLGLMHDMAHDAEVGDLLKMLGWKRGHKGSSGNKAGS